VRRDRHRGLLLLPRERRRYGPLLQRGYGGHGHVAPVPRLEKDILQVSRVVYRICSGNELHAIGTVGDIHVADILAVEHGLHGVGQAGDGYAEVRGALTVNNDGELRLRRVDGKPRLQETRIFLHLLDDPAGSLRKGRAIVADEGELKAAACAAYAETVRLDRKNAQTGHLLGQFPDLGDDLLLSAFPFLPRRKRHHHEAGVVLAVIAGTLEGAFDQSEEHTSELQSRENLVCRLLL